MNTFSGTVSDTTANFMSGLPKLRMFSVILLLVVAVFALVFFVLRLKSTRLHGIQLIGEPIQVQNSIVFCKNKIKPSTFSADHTMSFWMYIQSWTTEGIKILAEREYAQHTLVIFMEKEQPDLRVVLIPNDTKIVRNDALKTTNSFRETCMMKPFECFTEVRTKLLNMYGTRLENVNIQSWNHLAFSFTSRSFDVFLNGKLAKTHVLKLPLEQPDKETLKICPPKSKALKGEKIEKPAYVGYISRCKYFPRILTPREVYTQYTRGPSSSQNANMFQKLADINMTVV